MIKVNEISRNNNIISAIVRSTECIPPQEYRIIFDIVNEKCTCDIPNPDSFDLAKVKNRIISILQQGEALPDHFVIVNC